MGFKFEVIASVLVDSVRIVVSSAKRAIFIRVRLNEKVAVQLCDGDSI